MEPMSPPLCTLRWRRRLETTEKWRPQPLMLQMKAVIESVNVLFTLLDDQCLTFLPCVTVHMGLERAGSGEAFVANLAFVLLQCAR